MDAGSVLNALLARHDAYLRAAASAAPPHRQRRRLDGALASAHAPPPKVVEAVQRGVNPLMLGTDLHAAEAAARQRAKGKRAAHAAVKKTSESRVSSSAAKTDASLKSSAQDTQTKLGTLKGKNNKTPPSNSHLFPLSRKADQARGEAISKTLVARHRALRAQSQEDEDARKRARSTSSTSEAQRNKTPAQSQDVKEASRTSGTSRQPARAEPSASVHDSSAPLPHKDATPTKRTRRDIWRRRCTTRKTLRLTQGVSRAVALRRHWYTSLNASATKSPSPGTVLSSVLKHRDTSTKALPAPPTHGATPLPQPAQDAVEAKCAGRRRLAARRVVLGDVHTRLTARRMAAAAATKGTSGEASLSIAAVRHSRRQYENDLRRTLLQADVAVWGVAARVVAERQEVLRQLTSSCGASAMDTGKDGVLPLLLARHFPLFGALMEVQELEVQTPRLGSRSTRHRRRARYASAVDEGRHDGKGTAVCAARLCVLQRHAGVVVEDYADSVGVLLLPFLSSPSSAGRIAWANALVHARIPGAGSGTDAACASACERLQAVASSPRVARVPKHFPGASGALAELLPRLLAATRGSASARVGDAFSAASQASMKSHHTRVRAAIFCGEVEDRAQAGVVVDGTDKADEERDAMACPYPLKRLLNRCL